MPSPSLPPASLPIGADELSRQVDSLRRLARALVGDAEQAEDLAQDAWLAWLRRPPRSPLALRAWLATTARRLALDRARSRRRVAEREAAAARPEAQESHEAAVAGLEIQQRVLDRVLALREPYRTALYLRYWEGLEPGAIAGRLGEPVKTVKTRLARALVELREQLDAEHGGARERWLAALAPIAMPSDGAVVAAGAGGVLAGVLIVKKSLVVLIAVVLAFVAWRVAVRAGDASGPRAAGELAAPVTLAHGGSGTGAIGPSAEPAPLVEARREVTSAIEEEPAPATGALVVLLRYAGGAPAADIAIRAHCETDPAPRREYFRARTDAEGRARFPSLFAGEIRVYTDRGSYHEVQLAAGEEREVVLDIPRGERVLGRVTRPDGEPASGAEVWRDDGSFGALVARARADGSFELTGFDADVQLEARASGFVPSPRFELGGLPVGPDGARVLALALGASGAGLGGRVVDPTGAPVAGAEVKAGPRGGWIRDLPDGRRGEQAEPVPVETDAEGRFSYAGGLPEGVVPIHVSARGWPVWSDDVELRADQPNHVEVVLRASARVEGRVLDPEGRPVPGAEVICAVQHGGGWYFDEFPVPQAEADAEGRFRLDWVAPGVQELNAHAWPKNELGRAKVSVTCASGETTFVDLVLDPGLTIEGRVVDRDAKPLAGWRVDGRPEPYGQVYPRQCTTDAEGRFRLANLDAGYRYTLSVNAPDEYSITPRATLDAVEPGARDLSLVAETSAQDARLAGRLLDADGSVPRDVRLVYYPEGSNSGGFVDFDAETGAFEQASLPAGRYELHVQRGGRTVHETELRELRSGATTDFGLVQLDALGRVVLVLTGIPEDELARLEPRLDREGHGTERLEREGDEFRSRELAPGTWRVGLFGGAWFLRAGEVAVRSGAQTRVEISAERAFEVRAACAFADPEASWRTLHYEVRDARGDVVLPCPTWFRAALQDGKVPLHGLALPAGRHRIEAWTDTELRGGADLDVGPGTALEPELRIVLR